MFLLRTDKPPPKPPTTKPFLLKLRHNPQNQKPLKTKKQRVFPKIQTEQCKPTLRLYPTRPRSPISPTRSRSLSPAKSCGSICRSLSLPSVSSFQSDGEFNPKSPRLLKLSPRPESPLCCLQRHKSLFESENKNAVSEAIQLSLMSENLSIMLNKLTKKQKAPQSQICLPKPYIQSN